LVIAYFWSFSLTLTSTQVAVGTVIAITNGSNIARKTTDRILSRLPPYTQKIADGRKHNKTYFFTSKIMNSDKAITNM